MKHYDDTELIERYYLPGPGDEAQEHLASCAGCRDRFASLTETLRENADEPLRHTGAKPEFFWERQALRIRERTARQAGSHRFAHLVSIAATLVMLLGGSFLLYRQREGVAPAMPNITMTALSQNTTGIGGEVALQDVVTTQDPWSADQLKPYRDAVEWESWLASEQPDEGGQS